MSFFHAFLGLAQIPKGIGRIVHLLVRTLNIVPPHLRDPILVDDHGLLRFWAAAWVSLLSADLAPATVAKKLGQLEGFYQQADLLLGPGGVDNALADFDVNALSDALEGYFHSIRNSPIITSASEERWQLAIQFVCDNIQRISRGCQQSERRAEFHERMREIELSHSNLHIGRRRRPERIRSLPPEVVEFLYNLLDPESSINPFQNEASRWRVYVCFVLMLHQGLRRGELLILPVDAIRSSKDRFWINVKFNEYEDDSRYSAPSIKNDTSVRQLPVSNSIAAVVQEYASNHRGRVNHSFLLNSQKRKPLSPEGVRAIFVKITDSLPKNLRKCLCDCTGSDSITPHDLRHTSAVVRLNQLLLAGVEMEDALQRLRAFFGWSRTSDMPLRYARAVFENRMSSVWNADFDDRASVLRSITVRPR
ncbi:MAG: site-specific integrase [Terracidiphilus sp.]|nr:site-specific integrase [Terracidiphilus sp.]